MQEEAIPISEEEASDSEIVMISHHRQSMSQQTEEQRVVDRHLRSQEKLLDNQLRALGLYEDGLSYEQKEELLAVVAASRETAEQEESMRLQAQEWQQRVFPNDSEFESSAHFSSEPKDRSSSPTQVEDSMQLLNIEEDCGTPGVPQDVYDISEMDDMPSKVAVDPANGMEQSEETGEMQCKKVIGQRGRARRGARGRGQLGMLTVTPTLQVCMDPEVIEQEASEATDDPQVDHRKQKKDLEKLIPDWRPCISPDDEPLVNKRLSQENFEVLSGTESSSVEDEEEEGISDDIDDDDNEEEEENDDEDVSVSRDSSIDKFHACLEKFQRTCGAYIPWGQPVTVGRTYATRSTRGRAVDTENSDCVLSFQPPGISDELFQSDEGYSEKYLQLQQYDKLFCTGLDSGLINSTRTISPVPLSSLLGSAMSTIQPKRTRYSEEQLSSGSGTFTFAEQKEDYASTSKNSPSEDSVVFCDWQSAPPGPSTSTFGLGNRGPSYFSETVTRLQHASSDSSIDVETCDNDLPVRKDGTKTYSAKRQSVSESAVCQDDKDVDSLDRKQQ